MSEDYQGMIDVGDKPESRRTAVAESVVRMKKTTSDSIDSGEVPKGNVLEAARNAAMLAAKRTPGLLPHCHPIRIDRVAVSFTIAQGSLLIKVTAAAHERTGVEMEALTGAAIAALTVYDMCKGIDDSLVIENVRLIEKKKDAPDG